LIGVGSTLKPKIEVFNLNNHYQLEEFPNLLMSYLHNDSTNVRTDILPNSNNNKIELDLRYHGEILGFPLTETDLWKKEIELLEYLIKITQPLLDFFQVAPLNRDIGEVNGLQIHHFHPRIKYLPFKKINQYIQHI